MGDTRIRAGIGGWTYEPWRGVFYPAGLAQKRELEYASKQLTAIEINGTYYRNASPTSFASWRDQTPDDFVFSVKATRYATNRKKLADAAESVERFLGSGLTELGPKLGPLLWQLPTYKQFDAEDIGTFFSMLPNTLQGVPLRHVLEVRHASFQSPEYIALARQHNVATVLADSDEFPVIADLTGDFVYGRLMKTQSEVATGYSAKALTSWVERAVEWAGGGDPADLPHVAGAAKPAKRKRDVFLFFIAGAKERAPAAAQAFLAGVKKKSA